MTVYSSEK